MSDFTLPDLGEGLTEAEVVEWHVGAGDHVVIGQPLVSVETDKSVVEVPSPRSGTVAAVHGEPGDLIRVGAPLVSFADEPGADSGTVVGALPAGAGKRAAPAVRALARTLGVDLTTIAGTGPGGTITTADVASADAGGRAPVPLRGVRRAMAANMARAHSQVVPSTVQDVVDIGDWAPGTDPTLRLLRAVGAAAVAEPACNSEYLGPDHGLRPHDEVHVGVAVETGDGLFVPVLRNVAERTSEDLRAGLDRMRADLAARSIPPEELAGATITLSNFGMFGGLYAHLVLLPPQVAIVGAGRIHDAAVARDGAATVRRVLPLSLTFDHRVVTGVEATRFLTALMADLSAAD